MGERLYTLHRSARIFRRDPESPGIEALYQTPYRDHSQAGWGRVDCRDRSAWGGWRTNQPGRNRVDGVPVAVCRARDHDAPDQRIGIRALEDPGLRDWLEEDWSRVDLAVEE